MKRKWTTVLLVLWSIFSLKTALAQTYAPAVNYAAQLQPVGLAKGDFNEDGKTDIILTNAGSSTLSLFLGNGDGTVGNAISIAVGANPISVVAADFDGDGHLDLAVSLGTSQSFQVLFGIGNGTFQAPVSVPIPGTVHFTSGQIVQGDFNGDRKPDLAIATDLGVAVFLNNGTGGFREASVVEPAASIANLVVADVNGDGKPDLVGTESTFDVNGNSAGNVFISRSSGDGTFQAASQIIEFSGTPAGIAVGDLNNDGLIDLVVSNSGGVIGGSDGGAGGCTPRICLPVDGPPPIPPTIVPGQIILLLQQADATFTTSTTLSDDRNPGDVELADLNGDGRLDIIEASSSVAELLLYQNQGSGSFSAPTTLSLPVTAASVLPVSLSNTVALDLAATLPVGNEVALFVNQGANTLSLTSSANPSLVGGPVTLSATVHPSFAVSISGSVIFADGANTLGSSPVSPSGVSTLTTSFGTVGTHSIVAVYSGSPALVGGSSAVLSQQVNAATATVSLASSGNPSVFGQAVSLNISVAAGGSGSIPTGTVNVLDSGSIIFTGVLDSSGKAVDTVSTLSLGTHTLTARYSGDTNYGPATSAPITQTVNKSNAAVNLSSAINPSVFGQGLSFAVAVSASGGSGIPTGTVTLNDAGVSLGSTALDGSGSASFAGITLAAGSHFLTATYAGDQNFAGGVSGPVTQIVNKANSSTSLTTSPNPSGFGQPVQLSATVGALAPATGFPTGSVVFSDGVNQLGSAVLVNGKASLSVSSLGTGSHSLTAAYGGDANFNPSGAQGANSVTQNVGKNSVAVTISASPNPSTFGQIVTLTANFSTAAGGSVSPTGSVSFSDGTISLGSSPIVGGVATLSVTSLAPGSHSVVGAYSGDNNFSAAASSVLSVLVNKLLTTTALTSSMNPTTNASSLVLNAVVTANGKTPSGSVALFDGGQQLTASQLDSSGRTSFPISNLSSGTHNFSAAYSGDVDSAASLSTLKEVVVDSHSSVTLTSSANPQLAGAPVTFVATATPALGGQVTTGMVTFTDGQRVLASVPVANSVASLTTKALSVGQHSILASFQEGSLPGPFDGISSALVETIDASPVNSADFTLTLQAQKSTLKAGQTFATQITLTPVNGLTGQVRTICLGAPRGATCSINPEQGTFDGSKPISARLLVTTTGPQSAAYRGTAQGSNNSPQPKRRTGMGGTATLQLGILPAALLGFVFLPRAKRKARCVAVLSVLALSLTGCGSDMSARGPQPTPPGSYTLIVQSQSGSITHSQSLQLVVR
jgi:hypothetical protein